MIELADVRETGQAPARRDAGDRPAAARVRVAVTVGGMVAVALLAGVIGVVIGQQGPPGTAAVPLTGPAAVGFTQDMAGHLEQAVTIAAWARDHSGDPAVRELAAEIEMTESVQLGRMRGWLDVWGSPAQPSGEHLAWMAAAAADDHQLEDALEAGANTHHAPQPTTVGVQMPGRVTDEDLQRLRLASGAELDVVFLQLILRHHEGAEVVLDYGSVLVEVDQVRELAEQMHVTQAEEGNRMREMLAARGAAPLTE